MRVLLWSLFISVIILIIFDIKITPIISHYKPSYTLPVYKTLYVSQNINDEEMFRIMEASIEWSDATNGQVVFNVERIFDSKLNHDNAIIVFNVTPDNPDIILIDGLRGPTTLGYYNNDANLAYIAIVEDRLDDLDYNYKEVILHELGHSLGLEHSSGIEGIGTLMYPTINAGSTYITDADLKQFCKLYNCDASQFNGK